MKRIQKASRPAPYAGEPNAHDASQICQVSSSKWPHFLQKFHQNRYSKNLKCNECYVTNIIKKITTTLMAMKLPLISTPILYGLFITTHSYSILIQCWIVTAVLLCSALPNSVTTPGASHPITLPWAATPQCTDTCLKNGDRTPLGIHAQEVFHFSIQMRCQTLRATGSACASSGHFRMTRGQERQRTALPVQWPGRTSQGRGSC